MAADDLDEHLDINDLAALFLMAMLGLAAMIRSNTPAEHIHAASRTATRLLDLR
jgi:hypothetical protein